MKANKFRFVVGLLLVILGTAHTLATPHFYKTFNLESLWFAGSGLALMFLGSLNIVGIADCARWSTWMRFVANIMGTIFIVTVAWVLPVPQAFIGVSLLVALLACSVAEVLNNKHRKIVSHHA